MTSEQQQRWRERANAGFVQQEWTDYQKTKDRRHLANICREVPFFGYPEVGEEIARLLTLEHTLTPITRKPALEQLTQNATIKGLWLSWKDATYDDGTKVPEKAIMHTIGKKVGITSGDEHNIYEAVRQRLKKMGLK
jgi:hypothetical protein